MLASPGRLGRLPRSPHAMWPDPPLKCSHSPPGRHKTQGNLWPCLISPVLKLSGPWTPALRAGLGLPGNWPVSHKDKSPACRPVLTPPRVIVPRQEMPGVWRQLRDPALPFLSRSVQCRGEGQVSLTVLFLGPLTSRLGSGAECRAPGCGLPACHCPGPSENPGPLPFEASRRLPLWPCSPGASRPPLCMEGALQCLVRFPRQPRAMRGARLADGVPPASLPSMWACALAD